MSREEFNRRYAKYIEELGGVEAYREIAKERDRKRSFYSGFAWGVLTVVVICLLRL